MTISEPEVDRIPPHVPPHLVRWLDHHNDAEARSNPLGYLDGWGETTPAFYSPAYEGFWVLTRFEDVREVLRTPEVFSSCPMGIPGWTPGGSPLIPIMLDPPEHRRYRALIDPAFTPKRARSLEPLMRTTATSLVAGLAGAGECEFIADFAEPYSTQMFAQVLGLPPEEGKQFINWNNTLLHTPPTGDGPAVRQQAATEINAYLQTVVAERKGDPRDDVISALLDSEIDGRRLDDDEIQRITMILFMAGLDTVTAAHGFAWKVLAEQPHLQQLLVTEPHCLPDAVEELLRLSSVFADSRTAVATVDIAGVTMQPGDRVLLPTFAADRDPTVFTDPCTADFRRTRNPHMAFGLGPHRCLGSHLARLELKVALEVWHAAIPAYRILEGHQVLMHSGNLAGVHALPLTWPAAPISSGESP